MRKILLLALVGIFLLAIGTSRAYTIKANSVFINDSNVYVSAEPHTLYSSGYVTFTVQPKDYTGDVNVIWGFNTSQTIPTSAELYHPHNVSWNTTSSYSVTNVNGFWETTKPCDYGNEYNTYKREVNYTLSGNNTTTTEQKVFCFDSWSQEGSDYTINWHTEHTKQVNWVDISQYINSIEHDFDGKNKWYYATNLPVVAGHTYILRSYIKIPVSLEGSSGKYDFAIYPSSYGTNIGQAISNGHFYYLDPWWNASYSYRRNITSVPSSSLIFPINGTSGSDIDSNGRDEQFYGYRGDSSLALYYNDENSSALASDTDGYYLIQTTPQVSTSGTAPSNLLLYMPLDNSDTYAWDFSGNGNNGTIHGATQSVTGKFNKAYDFEVDNSEYIDLGYDVWSESDFSDGGTICAWVKGESFSTKNIIFSIEGRGDIAYIDSKVDFFIYTNDYYRVRGSTLSTGTWYFLCGTWDGSNVYLYEDGSLSNSSSMSGTISIDAVSRVSAVGSGGYNPPNGPFDGIIDDVRVYNRKLTATEIEELYNASLNSIMLLGSEEAPSIISGTVKDASGNAISGARVYILYQNNNTLLANLTTNATGGFEYSTGLTGNFSICAYNPTNVSQGGSCKPFVEVT